MKITVIPDSVRVNPVNVSLYENKPGLYKKNLPRNYLYNNPLWSSREKCVNLKGAGNETVAFQVVLIFNNREYRDVKVSLKDFKGKSEIPHQGIELYKEWFVDIQVPSSGYEKTSLAPGWFPDALIPLNSPRTRYYGAPFYLPDYWNRIKGQRAGVIWVDIFIPPEQKPGKYRSAIVIESPDFKTMRIPVALEVWPFSLPDKNSLMGNIYTNVFRKMPVHKELQYQHVFKKHRIANHQCYYRPELEIADSRPRLDWKEFDARLTKYFDGSAFTEKYGYFGPGYNEPMEIFLLPFNCSGKKGAVGWPLPTDGKKDKTFWSIWEKTAQQVAKHLFHEKRISKKTQVHIFFNALDECYDRKDHQRMIMWSTFIKKHFPDALFRIDGGYDDDTMDFLCPHVDLCLYHTIAYNLPSVEKYRKKGVRDWIYGPMIYESETNGLTGSSTFTDLDLLTMRGLGWVCFKYGADSWCQWEFAFENRKAWYNPETFKNSDLKEFRCYNGSGMFLYEGTCMGLPDPCVSIRFKAARSGAQEYEYLKMLKDLGGNPSQYVDKLVYRPLGNQAIGNIEPWNTNIAAWDKTRLELGEAIAKRI
jgi:hypothetical protein